MADISIPGVTGKYKTDELVSNLMKLERVPLEREQKALEGYQFEQGAWRLLNQKMSALRESSRLLYSFDNPFNNKIASSSDEGAVSVSAGRGADLASFQVEVLQTAAADKFMSDTVEKGMQVPAGAYDFTVGGKNVSVNWQGGKIEDFVSALNKRSNGLMKASLIGVSAGKQALVLESLKTGEENRLVFGADSEQLAKSIGMLKPAENETIVFGIDDSEIQSAAGGDEGLSKSGVQAGETGITAPQRSAFTVPIPESVLTDENQTIQFSVRADEGTDITEAYNTSLQDPVIPASGSVQYGNITVNNIDSDTTLPERPEGEERVPLAPVDSDFLVFVQKRDGSEETLPVGAAAENQDGSQSFSLNVSDYPDITGITIKNPNTSKTLSLSPFTAFNAQTSLGYEPANAISRASDAKIKYEGVTVSRPTNEIDDIVPDVTISLHAKTDSPATVSVAPDTEAAKNAVIEFVGNYNRLVSELNILTQNAPEIISELTYLDADEKSEAEKRLGLFRGEFSLTNGKSALQNIMANVYPTGDDAELISLAQMGISTRATGGTGYSPSQLRGYLEIDEKKLDEALQTDMADIRKLFGYDSDGDMVVDSGIAYLVDQRLLTYVQTNGILATKTSGLDRRIQTSRESIQKLEIQLEAKEAQLKQQYGQMESTLNSLESQQDTITNFSRRQQNNSN